MADLRSLIERLYPEREFFLRSAGRVTYLQLPRHLQIAGSVVVLMVVFWLIAATAIVGVQQHVIESKNATIDSQQLVYEDLVEAVKGYQANVATVSSEIQSNQARLLSHLREIGHFDVDVAQSESAQDGKNRAGGESGSEDIHAGLRGHVAQLNSQLTTFKGMNEVMAANLGKVHARLAKTMSERDKVAFAHSELWARLQDLRARHADEQRKTGELRQEIEDLSAQLDASISDRDRLATEKGAMEERMVATEEAREEFGRQQFSIIQRLTRQNADRISEAERVLRMTSIDLEKFMARAGMPAFGQGGPFVAASATGPAEADLLEMSLSHLDHQMELWEGIKNLMTAIPLHAPVDSFYVSSGFGRRIDPFTKRPAQHYGLDLSGRYNTPIYAGAPGVVTFAGRKGNYGRLIEIDHGHGLRTRYGHLRRILVKRGEKVGYRQKIGLMGSSGRSTGPHLHYEIWANGKPHDPAKFLHAGRYLFKPSPTAAELLGYRLPRPKPIRTASRD